MSDSEENVIKRKMKVIINKVIRELSIDLIVVENSLCFIYHILSKNLDIKNLDIS